MANIGINVTENGTTTLATAGKYCDRNIDVVVEVAGGGGAEVPEEALTLTGDASYGFYGGAFNNLINHFGNHIKTKDITNAQYLFSQNKTIEEIPFKINFKANEQVLLTNAFEKCSSLKELPEISTVIIKEPQSLLNGCENIRYADDLFSKFDYSYYKSTTNKCGMLFYECRSLRRIPYEILANTYPAAAYNRVPFSTGFAYCYVLDEIVNIPLPYTSTWTGNAFGSAFSNCMRLKELTFEVNSDGTPKVMNWKSQTIDLVGAGVAGAETYIIQYNSGITKDKAVRDDETYQALKNDPDWFTSYSAYSRYNHDSAVNTINSLPDTSAYIASAGGTNTIRFSGSYGWKTDGGAINTLTDAEIAVAAAKGWTVTLA